MKIPVPLWARAPMRAANLVLVGSLPEPVRDHYGFAWSHREEVVFRAVTAASRAGRPLVPRPLRRGSCLPFYDIVAKQERAALRAGRDSFDVPEEVRGETLRTARDRTITGTLGARGDA